MKNIESSRNNFFGPIGTTESENCVFDIQNELTDPTQAFKKLSGPNPTLASYQIENEPSESFFEGDYQLKTFDKNTYQSNNLDDYETVRESKAFQNP